MEYFWQPEVAVNYSCLFFLSIYNLFIIKIIKKKKKNIIKFINNYKLETSIKTKNRQEEN